jgi:transposase
MSIPGIAFISALTLYTEICDIKRFSNAEKVVHYAGVVTSVHQSGEHSFTGREIRGDARLKWILIEVAWCHERFFLGGFPLRNLSVKTNQTSEIFTLI